LCPIKVENTQRDEIIKAMKIEGIHPFEFENKRTSFVNAEKVVKELKYPIATIGPTKSLLEKLKAKKTPMR
tara:strand:+ start:191 stop:403 length:213 start_codon:yes stop_codon:yes gene_type:complete